VPPPPALRRGDLLWLDLDAKAGDPQAGREIAKRRPCLAVSDAAFHRATGLAWVCPITSTIRGLLLEVPLPKGARIEGVVRTDQLRSLDLTARNAERIGPAPAAVTQAVLERLRLILGL